jgi:hypothetical protein
MESECNKHLNPLHDVHCQIFDAFDLGDCLREETPNVYGTDINLDVDETSANLEHLEDLYKQVSRPIYDGINVDILSTTTDLINMAVIYGVTNAYFNELLRCLETILLPRRNRPPKTHYEAKHIIQRLDLNYKIIEACPSKCVLFHEDKKHMKYCPIPSCRLSRYIAGF